MHLNTPRQHLEVHKGFLTKYKNNKIKFQVSEESHLMVTVDIQCYLDPSKGLHIKFVCTFPEESPANVI